MTYKAGNKGRGRHDWCNGGGTKGRGKTYEVAERPRISIGMLQLRDPVAIFYRIPKLQHSDRYPRPFCNFSRLSSSFRTTTTPSPPLHSRPLRTQELIEWSRPTSEGGKAATFLIDCSSTMAGMFLIALIK